MLCTPWHAQGKGLVKTKPHTRTNCRQNTQIAEGNKSKKILKFRSFKAKMMPYIPLESRKQWSVVWSCGRRMSNTFLQTTNAQFDFQLERKKCVRESHQEFKYHLFGTVPQRQRIAKRYCVLCVIVSLLLVIVTKMITSMQCNQSCNAGLEHPNRFISAKKIKDKARIFYTL